MTFGKILIAVLLPLALSSQTRTTVKSGLWNNPLTWSPAGIPGPTDNVVINDNHTIDLTATATCSNIQVGVSSAAVLRFAGPVPLSFTVNGSITVNSLSSVVMKPGTKAFHSLYLYGDIISNGLFDLRKNVISLTNAFFVGNNNQSISGSGNAEFNIITVNKGSSALNVLDVSVAGLVTPDNFLTLLNGTFRLSTPNLTLVPFTVPCLIGPSTGITINAPNAIVSTSAGVTVTGKLELLAGVLNIGDAANEDLAVPGGSLIVSGGSLNVAGKLDGSGGMHFSMTDGQLRVPVLGSANTSIAPFHVSGTGSSFNMNGGRIIIAMEGGTGSQDLGFFNTSAGSVMAGTLQVGEAASPPSQSISIYNSGPVPDLQISSANVSAFLTNSLQVINDISIQSGTLSSNSMALQLGGNWYSTGTFLPGNSTVSLNGAAQEVFISGGENFHFLHFSGSGVKTLQSPVSIAADLFIESGSGADAGTGSHSISLAGDLINNGSFNAREGTVAFTGSLTQNLGGTAVSDFYNMELNNPAGLTLSQASRIRGTLSLNNGNFNLNGQAFTLLSDGSGTARIGPIAATGDITGNVTVQKFIPGGATGWSLLGSPIAATLDFTEWDDDLFISCPSCPDGYVAGFPSIYSYVEAPPGAYDDSASYLPISAITDPLVQGKGYWVYSGTGKYNTADQNLDMTGPVRKFNYAFPLSYNNHGSALDDGWNLIHNPYPSPLSWSLLRAANTNIDNAVYTYNADLNAGTGGFASYVNGISSPAPGSGGIGDNIPICQGFFIHCTAPTTLLAQENMKSASNQALLRSANQSSGKSVYRILLKGPYNFKDETVLYFENGAANGFDMEFDALKMRGQNPYAPVIALENAEGIYQVNGVAPVTGTFSIYLKTLTGYPGSYTISVEKDSTVLHTPCMRLFDRFTLSTTDMRDNAYSFFLSDTTQTARFEFSVISNTLHTEAVVRQPDCYSPLAGKISLQPAGQGPWDYSWYKDKNLFLTSKNQAGPDSVYSLAGGFYHAQVNTSGACDNSERSFTIIVPEIPVADFNCVDSADIAVDPAVVFNNLSSDFRDCIWDFGDGVQEWNNGSPVHIYKRAGLYTVRLICESSSACSDTATRMIRMEEALYSGYSESMEGNELRGTRLLSFQPNRYILNGYSESAIRLQLNDVAGRQVNQTIHKEAGQFNLEVDMDHLPAGIYLMKFSNTSGYEIFKVPVIK